MLAVGRRRLGVADAARRQRVRDRRRVDVPGRLGRPRPRRDVRRRRRRRVARPSDCAQTTGHVYTSLAGFMTLFQQAFAAAGGSWTDENAPTSGATPAHARTSDGGGCGELAEARGGSLLVERRRLVVLGRRRLPRRGEPPLGPGPGVQRRSAARARRPARRFRAGRSLGPLRAGVECGRLALMSDSAPPSDRRAGERHLACFPASLERADGEQRPSIIRDLSESGALLLVRTTKITVGDAVKLQLYITEDAKTFRVADGQGGARRGARARATPGPGSGAWPCTSTGPSRCTPTTSPPSASARCGWALK